jgi:hypothetical protein
MELNLHILDAFVLSALKEGGLLPHKKYLLLLLLL